MTMHKNTTKIIQKYKQLLRGSQQQKSALPKQICLGNNDADALEGYNQHLVSLRLFVSHSRTNISNEYIP